MSRARWFVRSANIFTVSLASPGKPARIAARAARKRVTLPSGRARARFAASRPEQRVLID